MNFSAVRHSRSVRCIALFLVLCLLFPVSAAALGSHSQWFDAELDEMDTQFGLIPDSLRDEDLSVPITRGEMCSIAVLAYEKLTGITHTAISTDHFNDTTDPAVNAAFELGIVNGYPDGTYRPDEHLTREQFCKILYNFSQLLNTSFTDPPDDVLSSFTDANNISSVYLDSVKFMVHLSVMRGTGKQLQPKSDTCRDQALALFFRYYKVEREAYHYQVLAKTDPTVSFGQADDQVTSEMNAIVNFALGFLGSSYVWGGTTPAGFDCSGFVQYVYRNFGYTLNRVAEAQYKNGVAVSADSLMPGDLVFFSNNGSTSGIYHVGIYIGNNQFVHAANSQRGVVVSYLNEGYYHRYYYGARRIVK
jgi:hypothetical protein